MSPHTHGVALTPPPWCLGSLPPLVFGVFWGCPPRFPPRGFWLQAAGRFPYVRGASGPRTAGSMVVFLLFLFLFVVVPLAFGLGGSRAGWVGWRFWVSTTLLGHPGLAGLAGGPLAGLWWALHKPAPLTLRWVDPFSPLGVPRRFLGPHPFPHPPYPNPSLP